MPPQQPEKPGDFGLPDDHPQVAQGEFLGTALRPIRLTLFSGVGVSRLRSDCSGRSA
jgi:hypothetical protein